MTDKLVNDFNYEEIVLDLALSLSEKKAQDVTVLDVKNLTPLTDFFIICHGESYVQLNALADFSEEKMKNMKIRKINEKLQSSEDPWVLMDFGFLIVHIFLKETRDFFNLEKLWIDAKVIKKY